MFTVFQYENRMCELPKSKIYKFESFKDASEYFNKRCKQINTYCIGFDSVVRVISLEKDGQIIKTKSSRINF